MDETKNQNLNNIPAVTTQKEVDAKTKEESTKSANKVDEIQLRIRRNKILFYGYPILVILFGISIVLFVILPVVQGYFQNQQDSQTLDQNLTNVKQTASNLTNAVNQSATYDQYETELSTYVPTEARVGQLIDLIQKKANDNGLEKQEIATTDTTSNENLTSLNNLAETDSQNNALFQSLTSGEVEFTPKSISGDAKAKLLAIDVNVKGKRDNLLKFLDSLKDLKPLINLAYIEYDETPESDGSASITASLRFESYALKLNPDRKISAPRKYTIEDSVLTTVLPIETFNVSSKIKEKIQIGSSSSTPTPTPTTSQ